jgi:hypothetical protein
MCATRVVFIFSPQCPNHHWNCPQLRRDTLAKNASRILSSSSHTVKTASLLNNVATKRRKPNNSLLFDRLLLRPVRYPAQCKSILAFAISRSLHQYAEPVSLAVHCRKYAIEAHVSLVPYQFIQLAQYVPPQCLLTSIDSFWPRRSLSLRFNTRITQCDGCESWSPPRSRKALSRSPASRIYQSTSQRTAVIICL